jgi:hypothetical protein
MVYEGECGATAVSGRPYFICCSIIVELIYWNVYEGSELARILEFTTN